MITSTEMDVDVINKI